VIEDWCIGCGLCARNCPYGNINLHEIPTIEEVDGKRVKATKKKATSCGLCTDLAEPSCVYACPHDAAHRVTERVASGVSDGPEPESEVVFGARSE